MADDLEAFLRQAAQRRSQRQKPAQRQPAPPPPQPPSTSAPPRRTTPVVEAVVVPEVVSSLVRPRVDTSEFNKRAEQLGEEVGLADEAMESHLQQKFDHQVGTLSHTGLGKLESSELFDAADESQSSVIGDLVAMLRSPDTVRQAILLSEILSPPQHRW